jgi:hypothetical protein
VVKLGLGLGYGVGFKFGFRSGLWLGLGVVFGIGFRLGVRGVQKSKLGVTVLGSERHRTHCYSKANTLVNKRLQIPEAFRNVNIRLEQQQIYK